MRLRQVRAGVGAEFDEIKTEVHVMAGWEDHNFLGGLRTSATFTPGVVLYPTRTDNVCGRSDVFPEEKLKLGLKQPGFIEARTTGFVRPESTSFRCSCRRTRHRPTPSSDTARSRGAIGAERTFFKVLYASLSYDVQVENPFSYEGALDPRPRDSRHRVPQSSRGSICVTTTTNLTRGSSWATWSSSRGGSSVGPRRTSRFSPR